MQQHASWHLAMLLTSTCTVRTPLVSLLCNIEVLHTYVQCGGKRLTHTHAHTRAHTHTHAHTHARTHTHTHTHTPFCLVV